MAMNSSTLYNSIKATALNYVKGYKVEHKHTEFEVKDGNISAQSKEVSDGFHLPSGDEGMEKLVDAIAQAVAEEVISHIQTMAEIKSGVVTTATLPYTNALLGAGGGVPGPVTIPPTALIIATGTINISPTGIQ